MKHLIIVIAVITSLSSCSKNLVPLTQRVITENNLTAEQVRKTTILHLRNVVLQNKTSKEEQSIAEGKIVVTDDKSIEQVVIKRKTPGIAIDYSTDGKIVASFEDVDSKNLAFKPNPKRGNRYYLFANAWNNGIGQITYDGREYYSSPESGGVYLMIDLKKVNDFKNKATCCRREKS